MPRQQEERENSSGERFFRISRETSRLCTRLWRACPVTIRFLDPPLHEFVPTEEADIKKLADAQGKTVEADQSDHRWTSRVQPDDGPSVDAVWQSPIRRSPRCRPRAVIRAAINVKKAPHPDWDINPEIMIPLVGDVKELKYVKKFVVETADAEIAAAGSRPEVRGWYHDRDPESCSVQLTMIAKEADFFCFGTNDLDSDDIRILP